MILQLLMLTEEEMRTVMEAFRTEMIQKQQEAIKAALEKNEKEGKAYQEGRSLIRDEIHELDRISLLHRGGKGDERRAVVDGSNAGRDGGGKTENVAAPDLEGTRTLDDERVDLFRCRLESLLAEKGIDGDLAELRADDAMALRREPRHVEALAAERHEHRRSLSEPESRPMRHEKIVNVGLMKADVSGFPALLPELRLHRLPFNCGSRH